MVDKKRSSFTLTLPSDREIVLRRVFDAPRTETKAATLSLSSSDSRGASNGMTRRR